MKNNKKIIIILIMFSIIFAVTGGTFAYLSWQTSEEQQTNVTFKVTQNFSCAADGGGNITSADVSLAPATCTNSTYAIQRTVTVKPTINGSNLNVLMSLWLNINDLGTGLSNSQNFKYALTTSNTSCETGIVSSGTFNGKTAGAKVSILEKSYSATTTETYYLYIWLDKEETSSETMNQTFDLSIGGDCTNAPLPYSEPILNGAAPKLDSNGMIPVTISDTGVTKTVAADSSNWYSYENKEWANAILVTSDSRSKYLGTDGVTVTPTDILAYYVWIPKYSYKMNGKETSISIAFNETPSGYTEHPAFTFGDQKLTGIWVGKFETTGDATTPTVLPDVQSLRSQNVSNQFTTSLKFSGGTLTDRIVTYSGNDTYGLSSTTNSHMMKNSEWGAAAYLSHSIYGANREIYINNSLSFYTGRSGGNVGGSTAINTVYTDQTSTKQYNSYGFYTWDGYLLDYGTNTKGTTHDITKVASTTGNITGIYDMSGGAWEYVMGVLADDNGNPRSGNSTSSNSGFNGIIYNSGNNTEYTLGISFPTSNYYDLYTSTDPTSSSISLLTTACNGGICYGHALSETAGWYGDYASFVSSSYPWFSRGGRYNDGTDAGAFSSSGSYGFAYSGSSWRSVLALG